MSQFPDCVWSISVSYIKIGGGAELRLRLRLRLDLHGLSSGYCSICDGENCKIVMQMKSMKMNVRVMLFLTETLRDEDCTVAEETNDTSRLRFWQLQSNRVARPKAQRTFSHSLDQRKLVPNASSPSPFVALEPGRLNSLTLRPILKSIRDPVP